jgi:DNA-binding response OmpR family regulator
MESERAKPRILVIDDDPATHESLAPLFASRGWETAGVRDAAGGLARLEDEPFDLVLIDLKLADGAGWSFLERIRRLRPRARTVVFTAEHTPDDIIHALREHAFSYFSKPFSPTAVADMVGRALETPSWEDDIEVVCAIPKWITLLVRCKMETADRLVQFLRELKMDLPPDKREDIAAALRELVLNAIEHGGHSDPRKRVRVSYVRLARAILYLIQDPGRGFSFHDISHAAVANPSENPMQHLEVREEKGVRPGGFGILVTRHLADELIYNESGNEVIFVKYLKEDR